MKVPVVARLKVVETGREYDVTQEVEAEYADSQEFWWTDGNAACDCNRAIFLNDQHRLGLDEECSDDRIELVALTVDGKDVLDA